MTKKNTLILALGVLGLTQLNAQNVGIGTATPATKTQIVQTAAVTALEVDHAGATGNTILAFPSNAANTSSALWIFNNSLGRGLNIDMNVTTSSSDGIRVEQDGTGEGIYIQHDNAGAGQFTNMTLATNTFAGLQVNHAGTGYGTLLNMSNTGTAGTGLYINQDGTGGFSRGLEIGMDAANSAIGTAVFHSGTGIGSYISLSNTASTAMGQAIYNSGLGRGLQVALSNTASTDLGVSVFHSGTGTGLYSQTQGQAVYGLSTGTAGRGGTFVVNNTAANTSTIGLFVVYDANTTGGTGGGGNAMEVQHNGTIGNAIDVFMGDPTAPAGPANTTSGYSCISASHMATGVGGATGFKSALSATSSGGDPAIFASNEGTEGGYGVHSQCVPGGAVSPRAFYGYSYDGANLGYGYGGYFYGGWRGLYAAAAAGGSGYGVFAGGDMGCTGPKTFLIDHPLDPENKELRHYSVESNEVLNMYRGIATIDASGLVVVKLPDYFDAANTNVTYQLTAIGTATQPYIAVEESNNEFAIAGAPNTKVSWTVHAQRNDPTLQYFDELGRNYSESEPNKPSQFIGKYHTPEAYGKDQNFAIDKVDTEIVKRGIEYQKNQKAMKLDNQKSSLEKVQASDVKPEKIKESQAKVDDSVVDVIEKK